MVAMFVETMEVSLLRNYGYFHCAKNSGNFGLKSIGKVRFCLVRPEYSGPAMEVVHFDRSDRNLPFHFEKPVHCPTFFYSRFHLFREFGKGKRNDKGHSSWLARFDR